MGSALGSAEGLSDGDAVGFDGCRVGPLEGLAVVGTALGRHEGFRVGPLGAFVGLHDGTMEGRYEVGVRVGCCVGAIEGLSLTRVTTTIPFPLN